MKLLLTFIVLLGSPQNILGTYFFSTRIIYYEHQMEPNIFCYAKGSCIGKEYDSPNIPPGHPCACHSQRSALGKCCIDSSSTEKSAPTKNCTTVSLPPKNFDHYMVDRCPSNLNSIWKDLCEKKWEGEDNIFKIAPVTSLDTYKTYKNYYCLKCHETADKVLYWILDMGDYHHSARITTDFNFNYKYSWLATTLQNISIPVKFLHKVSEQIQSLPISCKPWMISDCHHTGPYKSIRDKCNTYRARVFHHNTGYEYRNVHFALCNFESSDGIMYEREIPVAYGIGILDMKNIFNIAKLNGRHYYMNFMPGLEQRYFVW